MAMGEFFNTALFDIWGTTVVVWQVALGVLLFILSFFAFWLISYRLAPRLFKKVEVDKADRRKIR